MKKKLPLILAGTGAVLLGLFRRRKKKAAETAIPAGCVNYQDRNHLIFCDESNLTRRLLPLDSAINMRDIGGYTAADGRQTRWNKIFRSEELCHLTPEDEEKLAEYGIKHIYDFRDTFKAKLKPDFIPPGAVYENIPVLKEAGLDHFSLDYEDPSAIDAFMRSIYRFQIQNKADAFAEILKTIADEPDTVVLYHCTNGKDRTGTMTMLLLLIAGVPEDTILSDYTLSNLTFDEAFKTLGTIMAEDFRSLGIPKEKLRDFFGVKPEWLKIQLDYIREQGGIQPYLLNNTELTASDLLHIRNNILEDKPQIYDL